MMNKNTFARLIASLLIASALIGCIGCAADRSGAEPTATPLLMPTPTPQIQPVPGGELIMPIPANAEAHNPLTVSNREMLNMYSLIFEGLVYLDESGILAPMLAENWSCDETGRVWTFNIRRGVKWHRLASELTADDIIYTVNIIKNMDGGSYYSSNVSKIESIEKADAYTVRMTMTHAGISPVTLLTFPIICAQSSMDDMPVGTGPYAITSQSGDTITLEANKLWWKQTPYLERITLKERDNTESELASFAAGQLNMVFTSVLHAGRYRDEGKTSVIDIMTQTMETLLINHSSTILASQDVRKALAYGIDRSDIISNVYMNKAVACDVPIAPDSYAYDSKYKKYDFNRSYALSLLSHLGWEDVDDDGILENKATQSTELKLKLLVSTSADNTLRADAAKRIAAQLLEMGIEVEIKEVPFATEAADDEDFISLLADGDFDLALAGFNLGRDLDLTQYVSSLGALNYGKYYGVKLDALAKDLAQAADQTAARDAAALFQEEFIDSLPFIVLYFRQSSVIYSSKIKGVSSLREPDVMLNAYKWYTNWK